MIENITRQIKVSFEKYLKTNLSNLSKKKEKKKRKNES